jgi:hypothetical protein
VAQPAGDHHQSDRCTPSTRQGRNKAPQTCITHHSPLITYSTGHSKHGSLITSRTDWRAEKDDISTALPAVIMEPSRPSRPLSGLSWAELDGAGQVSQAKHPLGVNSPCFCRVAFHVQNSPVLSLRVRESAWCKQTFPTCGYCFTDLITSKWDTSSRLPSFFFPPRSLRPVPHMLTNLGGGRQPTP